MSHYTVAVFTDGTRSVDDLLAPYNENMKVEPYVYRTRQEIIDHARELADQYREKDEIKSHMYPYIDAKTDDELYAADTDLDMEHDAEGNEISTYNPDSKWDWYDVGGRWMYAFDAYGIDPAGTRVRDIKTTVNPDAYKRAIRFWEIYIEGKGPETEEDRNAVRFAYWKPGYYKEKYHDKETYAKCQSSFVTHSVVTPDGEWHEAGEMGWFGCSHETPEDGLAWELNYVRNYIEAADPDWVMTIVDCHI